MNTIINGIILSKYADGFKLTLLDQVLTKVFEKDKPAAETIELLKYATELALKAGKLERDIAHKVLQRVAIVQPTQFNEYFKFQSIEMIIANTYQNNPQSPISAVTVPSMALILQVLKLKAATTQDAKIDTTILTKLYMWLYSMFKAASSMDFQENICALLLYLGRTNDFLFISRNASPMLSIIVTWLGTADFINTSAANYNRLVQTLVDFMLLLWNNFSAHLVLETLNHVFLRVSSTAYPSPPSPAIANVLHCAPSSLIWAAAPYITANANIKDPQLELALSRIVRFPLTENTANWVVGLLQGLIEAKKFTVLARITIKSVHPVLSQIWVERTSKGALQVFEHIKYNSCSF